MADKQQTVFDKAIAYAVKQHSGQTRKGTNVPYIIHPMETASIVGTMTDDLEILAAAVLHDVVEDAQVTINELKERFGDRVAKLVAAESEDKRADQSQASTWKIRKSETISHLVTASKDEMMITLGDKLSNIRAVNRDYEVMGERVWELFNQKEKAEHAWYYGAVAQALVSLSAFPVYREYATLVNRVFG